MFNPHATDISEQERELGFGHIDVVNPNAPHGGESFCKAVAFNIGPSSYVFKLLSEVDGSIYFRHRTYGMTADIPPLGPGWWPIEYAAYISAEMAIWEAISDHYEDEIYKIIPQPLPQPE